MPLIEDNNTTPITLAHQVAELVTVALGELSLARQSAVSEVEFETAVERAEAALRQTKEPLQRLAAELASNADSAGSYHSKTQRGLKLVPRQP